jgi:hypothetical protein
MHGRPTNWLGHCAWRRGRALTGGSVVAGRRQGAVGELSGAIGRASCNAVGAELTWTAVQHRGGEVSGQRHSSAGRELQWPVAMKVWPSSVCAEEGRWGRPQSGEEEGVSGGGSQWGGCVGGVEGGAVAEGEGGEGSLCTTVSSVGRPAMAPDRQARVAALTSRSGQHSARWRGLKWIQWYSLVQTDSKTSKLWLIRNVPFLAPKM